MSNFDYIYLDTQDDRLWTEIKLGLAFKTQENLHCVTYDDEHRIEVIGYGLHPALDAVLEAIRKRELEASFSWRMDRDGYDVHYAASVVGGKVKLKEPIVSNLEEGTYSKTYSVTEGGLIREGYRSTTCSLSLRPSADISQIW